MLAHVPSFGRNPRGSPDFLAYPVPKACMHVLGTRVPWRLGVAPSASSPKAALALGCSLTPGLRISFGRVICMARAASVPGLWALGFLLLACVCGWVRVAVGRGFCLPLPVVAGVLAGCVWARFVVLSLFCRLFVVFVVGLWCRPAFGTCVVSCAFPLPPAVSGSGVRCGRACWARVSAVPRPSWLGCRVVFFALFFFPVAGCPCPGPCGLSPRLLSFGLGCWLFFLSACFGAPFPGWPLFLAWCCRFWLGGPPVRVWGSCLRCPLDGGFGPLLRCWRAVWWLWAFSFLFFFFRAARPPHFFFGGGGGGGAVVCGVWRWCVGGVVAGVWCGWFLATPGGGSCVLLPATPGWVSLPLVVGGPRQSWLGSACGGGVWCVVCGGGVSVGLWLVCGVVGPSPLLAVVPVCYSPPLLAGFRCRWWWAVPATHGWGPLAAVVCGVWCVVCGGGVLVGLWLVCGVVGPSPLLAEVPVCFSPPLLAGFRLRRWCVVCGVWRWCVGGVVAGVWCGWSLATPGGGSCVLLPATPGWVSLPVVVGGPRHSWLGSACGSGVWCVVCGGGVLVGLWLVCGVVGPSPLLAEVPVCYSPPLLAGFCCRWWWAVPATPGWGPLAAVVCGVWCVAVVCWWGCGWCVVWLVPRHSWRRFLCATPRHSWLGFAAAGGGRSPPLLAGVRWRRWCACFAWPGRAGRPPGRVLVRLTFSFGRFVFLLCLDLSGVGLPLSLSLLLPFLVGCFSGPPAAWLAPRLCLPLGRWLLFGGCSPPPPPPLPLAVFVAPACGLGVFFFSFFFFLRAPPLSPAFSGFRPRVPWASALALFVLLAFRFSALRALVPLSCFPPGCWLLPRGCCPPPPLCVSRFSFLPLGAVCRVVLCVPGCGAAPRCCALCRPVLCCCVLCCARLVPLLVAPCPLAGPVALWPRALRRCVLRCVLCAVCVLSSRGGACCCSPPCLVLCVSRGAVLCVPCALRSVRCCASLCWCARVVLFVWCVLVLAPGAVVRCCVLCCFLWCAVVRCWVWWPVVVCWWRVSVSVSLSGRLVCFPVVGVVCCGALLSCVVFCGAVLSRGAVLLCSAVVLVCCWGLLCPPVGRRAVLCCAVGWLCCFWPGGGVCVLWCSFPRAVRSLSSPLCALRCLVVLAVVPCFPVSCAVALCCRVVLCCRALLSFCGAVCVCFALLRPVVRRLCGLRCCWCLVLWRVPVRCGVSLGVLRCGGAALVCRGVLLCCALSCGVLRSVPCPAGPCCPAVLCWLAVLCGCLRCWCLFCPLFFC